jgi:hypothetical protein
LEEIMVQLLLFSLGMVGEGETKGRKLPLLPWGEEASRKNLLRNILVRICFRRGRSSCSSPSMN